MPFQMNRLPPAMRMASIESDRPFNGVLLSWMLRSTLRIADAEESAQHLCAGVRCI
jgi:hypothetical protein